MDNINYYNFADDRAAYPDAWLYVIWSPRGPGKTYSTLLDVLQRKVSFLYIKRTMEDVEIISRDDERMSLSPFKPINRDHGTDVRIRAISKGISGVYESPDSTVPIGTVLAMSAVHKYKGFDISEAEEIIFDEFIPQLGERVNRKEGQLLLDLYMTVLRDRVKRGLPETKLILLANATQVYCPITETLGIVDTISEMDARGIEFKYDQRKRILLHRVPWSASATEDLGIYAAMEGTPWAEMAFHGSFAYNDFSKVEKAKMKNMVCRIRIIYNRNEFFLYQHKETGQLYLCRSRGQPEDSFDMSIESEQRRFWLTWGIDLRNEISDGNMLFDSYSGYNLIYNFTKIFSV